VVCASFVGPNLVIQARIMEALLVGSAGAAA
jgi:hypothetical protein